MTGMALAGAFFFGLLLGCVVPSFVQGYKLLQFSYGKGYAAGRATAGALARRAVSFLVQCGHGVKNALGGKTVCSRCAALARAELERIQGPPRGGG